MYHLPLDRTYEVQMASGKKETKEMIEWLNDWVVEWLNDWMIEWLNDWMIEWLNDLMIKSLLPSVTDKQ